MQICFATQNRHKLEEVQAMLPKGIELVTPAEIGCLEPLPETQETLEGNSMQKAAYLFDNYGKNCFADDTGLEIFAMNGEPGVHSAHYAGPQRNAEENMKKVLDKLATKQDRKARFRTVITLILDGNTHEFEGILSGEILQVPVGEKGFGYDPIFRPEGSDKTLAQMGMEEKNSISHRGKAFKKLSKFLAERGA